MIVISLPDLPPSSNKAYWDNPNGGRVLTKAGKAYKTGVTQHVIKYHAHQTRELRKDATLSLLVAFGFPTLFNKGWPEKATHRYKKLDLDNRYKLLQDAIMDATAIDDSQICLTTLSDSSSSSEPFQRLWESLRKCNRTELYQLCKRAGLHPPTGATHTELAQYLLGEREVPQETNEIDLWRRGLKGFVEEKWAILQPQLTCPIRRDINACHGCLDAQVITCVVEQRTQETLIQLHRNRR